MESAFAYENLPADELASILEQLDREIAEGWRQLQARQAQQRNAISQLRLVRGGLSDLAWELEELEQRLHDLQAQREGPADPLVERELTSIGGRRADLEERNLAQMLQIDELAASIAAEEQALAAASAEWAARERTLHAERAWIAALLNNKAAERDQPPGFD